MICNNYFPFLFLETFLSSMWLFWDGTLLKLRQIWENGRKFQVVEVILKWACQPKFVQIILQQTIALVNIGYQHSFWRVKMFLAAVKTITQKKVIWNSKFFKSKRSRQVYRTGLDNMDNNIDCSVTPPASKEHDYEVDTEGSFARLLPSMAR